MEFLFDASHAAQQHTIQEVEIVDALRPLSHFLSVQFFIEVVNGLVVGFCRRSHCKHTAYHRDVLEEVR